MNYEESGKENMTNKNGVIVNVSGGQFAHAEGNAKMYVIQDNSIKGNEIDDIIKGIGENLSKIKNHYNSSDFFIIFYKSFKLRVYKFSGSIKVPL